VCMSVADTCVWVSSGVSLWRDTHQDFIYGCLYFNMCVCVYHICVCVCITYVCVCVSLVCLCMTHVWVCPVVSPHDVRPEERKGIVHMGAYLMVHMGAHLTIHMGAYLIVHMGAYLIVHMGIYLTIHMGAYLTIHTYACVITNVCVSNVRVCVSRARVSSGVSSWREAEGGCVAGVVFHEHPWWRHYVARAAASVWLECAGNICVCVCVCVCFFLWASLMETSRALNCGWRLARMWQ